ncbi:MAG: right-handed parallel beta-helix repeat-containing protein [Phycisphaerae bacterium]|nr:right-handed parallel beta-helix repeat-containing protein [Phycisphaerae bacterium]
MQVKVKRISKAIFCLSFFSVLGASGLYAQESIYVSLNPPVVLPDGSEFKTWSDKTVFTRTYYVDQRHPRALDNNEGSEENPFLTINKAAQVVRADEKVVVKSGVYRELVQPKSGGDGPDKMISFEAAPGAKVIIKGSRILRRKWTESKKDGVLSSAKLWMGSLPDDYFESDNPFLTENASKEDIDIMPWASEWAGKLPYTLGRGLVFQNGKRLVQRATYEELAKSPGFFWVEKENKRLHIYPYGEINPNKATFEITTQQHIFKPAVADLGYIRVKGFIFEHVGNGFPRTGVGALFTMGGHHWIIEDNIVRSVNSVGIEIGARTDETKAGRAVDGKRAERSLGYMIVRNNEMYECGTGGIQGLLVKNGLVENNRIHHCGWQNVQRYWETGAIKLLLNRGTLVRKNIITDIEAAPGIWMDYDNINSRVTQNVLANIESVNGAIFIEASQVPNIVDRNFVWNVKGSGIYQHDCDELTVAHNFVAHCSKEAVEMRICQGRMVNGRLSTCKRNSVLNNIFIKAPKGVSFIDDDNLSDNNIFVDCGGPFNFNEWRKKGFGPNSITAEINASFNQQKLDFTWSTEVKLPLYLKIGICTHDFFDSAWKGEKVPAGPFSYPTAGTNSLKLTGL